MNRVMDSPTRVPRVLALIGWTILIIGLFYLESQRTLNLSQDLAVNEARANFQKDQAFRFWVTNHGGIYVLTDSRTPPNPYLSQVPERDIQTPSGRNLTLMNPAYALRQLNEEYSDLVGVTGHITSLRPLRPENAPDEWEKSTLEAFETGVLEVFEFTELDGEPYLRLMQPMFVQEGCLTCHGYQGYNVGDVRGGVSVSVPMVLYLAEQRQTLLVHGVLYGLLWVSGCVGIVWGSNRLNKSILERDEANAHMNKAYIRGMQYAGKDARNKIMIIHHAVVLAEQGDLATEETNKLVKDNAQAAIKIMDGIIQEAESD